MLLVKATFVGTKIRNFKHSNLLHSANLLFRLIFNSKVFFFHFFITFFSANLLGQAPLWLHNQGAVEATQVVRYDSTVVVAGAFQGALEEKIARGGTDLFLYQYPTHTSYFEPLLPQKTYFVGGAKTEQWAALCAHDSGFLYGLGKFKDSLFFGQKDTVLYRRSSSVFVAQWTAELTLNWAKQLPATGLVKVWQAQCDAEGALYLTGSFQDTLFLEGQAPLVAACRQAPFLLKLDAQGHLLWGITSPRCQEAEGKALALDGQGRLYWAGEFSGYFSLKNSLERAHPVYRDLFLATLDAKTGQQIAQRQFSGVYDNQCVALRWHEGYLYCAGHFSGLLQFDRLLFKTGFKNFSNVYVVQLDSSGRAVWGSQSQAFADAKCTDLAVGSNQVYLCGSYRDSMRWRGQTALGMHKTEAFQMTLSTKDAWARLTTAQGRGFDVARGVALDVYQAPWLVGGFQDSIRLNDSLGIAQGFSDGFVWKQLPPNLALVRGVGIPQPLKIPDVDWNSLETPTIEVSPNPAKDSCLIRISDNVPLKRWELHHRERGLIRMGTTPVVYTKGLRPGRYCLRVYTKEFGQQQCLRIK